MRVLWPAEYGGWVAVGSQELGVWLDAGAGVTDGNIIIGAQRRVGSDIVGMRTNPSHATLV